MDRNIVPNFKFQAIGALNLKLLEIQEVLYPINLYPTDSIFYGILGTLNLKLETLSMSFTHILFDLDGTLTNPRLGIGNSLKYALRQMQIDGYSDEILERFVGPPLQDSFKNLFGLNERNTELAVEHFRTYFGENGLYENIPYSGVSELLEELHFSGKRIYVVTSKLEKFAKMIIRHFEFDRYVDDMIGAEATGKHSGKGQLIMQLMERNRIVPSASVVMIGDTHFDMIGAKENEILCIAVGYGFGTKETLKTFNPDYFVESVDELAEILLE